MSTEDIKLWAKYLTGKLTIRDGSLCKFSKRFFDVHYYKVHQGGNGLKMINFVYTCPYCKKEFTIK